MRIAFMGKGGSGKTTLAVAFTKFLLKFRPNSSVFLFDVDLNTHIPIELEIDFPFEKAFGGKFKEVVNIVEPEMNARFKLNQIPEFGTIPPNQWTKFIKLGDIPNHRFINKYGFTDNNLTVFVAGNHLTRHNHIGHSCYHDMLNAYELVIHRIIDGKNNYIIADTTAGIDNLGTSLYMAYDLVCFVIEPTERSLDVYKKYTSIPMVDKSKVYIVVNKVEDSKDEDFIQQRVEKERIIGVFKKSESLYKHSNDKSYQSFILDHIDQFNFVLNKLDSLDKNWTQYFKLLFELFKKESSKWWSNFYKADFEKIFPEDYSFIKFYFSY